MEADIRRCLLRIPEDSDGTRSRVFFRADNAGVAGTLSGVMFETFARHRVPLCPALVPAWITRARWEALLAQAGGPSPLWCWHQQGWRHKNHEPQGPENEFGPARPREELLSDMIRGRERLAGLLGDQFTPVFTPPWNRMSARAVELLPQAGFKALSRDRSSTPETPAGRPEFSINVDLHTHSGNDVGQDRNNLLQDIGLSLGNGLCGIMLHHQCMNDEAVRFLDILLAALTEHRGVRLVHFGDLLA